jgi:hypothetical protein
MHILNVGYDASVVFEALGSSRKFPVLSPDRSNIRGASERDQRNHAALRFFSQLFMEVVPVGEEFRYKISICLAELFMSDERIAGLMYPTIAMYADSDNIVLKPQFVDSHLTFDSAYYFAVTGVEPKRIHTQCFAVCVCADGGGHLKWIGPGRYWELRSGTESYLLPAQPAEKCRALSEG